MASTAKISEEVLDRFRHAFNNSVEVSKYFNETENDENDENIKNISNNSKTITKEKRDRIIKLLKGKNVFLILEKLLLNYYLFDFRS